MNLNTYNLCEDWGWYVDTENNLLINSNLNMVYNSSKAYNPYKNINYSRLCKIEEDEYDYYKNNYKDIENLELELEYNNIKNETKPQEKIGEKIERIENEKGENIYLYKIGSTTLITALLTYAIFFLI